MSVVAIAELSGGPCDGERCAVPLDRFDQPPAEVKRFVSPSVRGFLAGAQGAELVYVLASEPGVEPLIYRERPPAT